MSTINDKSIRYKGLLENFKKHVFKDNDNLLNPHNIDGFKYEVINPWELWQGNLDAEIMFIGQDFSDSASLENNLQNDWKQERNSPTNKVIIDFFKILGYNINSINYSGKNEHPLFFTNAILGIKRSNSRNMSKPIKNSWWKETSLEYMRELVDIIQPRCIVAMGRTASKMINEVYNIRPGLEIGSHKELPGGMILFAVQHCSPLGRIGRPLDKQLMDWKSLKDIIDN